MPITIDKNNAGLQLKQENVTHEMSDSVDKFFQEFFCDSSEFKAIETFDSIFNYIKGHDRIAYAQISNIIYGCFDGHESNEAMSMLGTLVSNMESVIAYAESNEFIMRKKQTRDTKKLEDTRRAIIKIWDHVNLAQQQYSVLKQTDEEYKQKFDKSIATFKDELTKDMNAQLLTMIGMFTALAFLIFGGISSLAGIFSSELPLLKLMVVGSVWGICIVNLIFVFLFCIGKMTKLSIKSLDDEDASIFQRYPIVWWSNYIILSILIISIWGYYINKSGINAWIFELGNNSPKIFTNVGTIIIILLLAITFLMLMRATKYEKYIKKN